MSKPKKNAPKQRCMVAYMMVLRTGGHAGKHKNKAKRGDGKGKGKTARHPKHKGRQDW